MEQEMLIQVAKEQLGVRNGNDIISFLAYNDNKLTESGIRDGKVWHLSDKGRDFLNNGGFSNRKKKEFKENLVFYSIIFAVFVLVALFIWTTFRIF